MNELMKIIEKQLNNCKKLLSVFQGERQIYKDNKDVGIKEIMEIMNKKKELVDAFEIQREIMKQLKDSEGSVSTEEREKRKDLVRELASLFEQLLVIDRENEMLLRNIMNTQQVPLQISKNTSPTFSTKERPALQRQLPLIPGMRSVTPAEVKPPVAIVPVRRTTKTANLIDIISKAVSSPKVADVQKEAPQSTPKSEENVIYKYKPKSCLKEYVGAGQLAKLASKYA